MDVAVPANLRCGRPKQEMPIEADPDWAPLNFSFAGIWEIAPQALEEKVRDVQIVDVREPSEFSGPLGHIAGAKLVPLGELQVRSGEIGRDKPVVTVCRAGSRSAQAYNLLRQAGFSNVANLSGGMLRWRAEGYAVEGGAS
jgi:rhodanese-related sulfurtransferase